MGVVRRGVNTDDTRATALTSRWTPTWWWASWTWTFLYPFEPNPGGSVVRALNFIRSTALMLLSEARQDAVFAVRHFARTPLVSGTVVLVLALGIGVNTATFTVAHSMLTSPPPGVPRDESVVRILGEIIGQRGRISRNVSLDEFQDYVAATRLFEAVGGETESRVNIRTAGSDADVSVRAKFVTPEYWKTLGLPVPRGNDADETNAGIVLGHRLWELSFQSDRSVIGRVLMVNGVGIPITGVAPERFVGARPVEGKVGPDDAHVWLPMTAWPKVFGVPAPKTVSAVIARLRPGMSLEGAAPTVAAIGSRIAPGPGSRGRNTAAVFPLRADEPIWARIRATQVGILGGSATLFVLLLTCANVAALMVGRAVVRQREIAVRLAIGASRFRIVRQMLMESTLLALAAAALIIGSLVVLAPVYRAVIPGYELAFDWPKAAFTVVCALGTALLFGQAPAAHAGRTTVSEALKRGSASTGGTRRGTRAQRSLVVAQVALTQPMLLAVVLTVMWVIGSARDRRQAAIEDQVFHPRLMPKRGDTTKQYDVARTRFATALLAHPAIDAVHTPQGRNGFDLMFMRRMAPTPTGSAGIERTTLVDAVPETPDYFAFMRIPFVVGGSPEVQPDQGPVKRWVVVGEDLAREMWGSASPLGQRVGLRAREYHAPDVYEVVGVVPAERTAGPLGSPPRVFVSARRVSTEGGLWIRGTGTANATAAAIREVAQADPGFEVVGLTTLGEERRAENAGRSRVGGLAALGGLVVLVLASLGLYAVVQLSVATRRREIGVRIALGATRERVVRQFFRQGATTGAIGLALGLGLSVVALRLRGSVEADFAIVDRPLYAAIVGLVVLAVTIVATWLPARAAARVDPIVVLKSE
jgi:putative ABC transport system permease protein